MLIAKDERRIFQRMAIEAGVSVIKGDIELQGICKDLSSTGMSIQLSEGTLKAGDNIEILLDTHNENFPPLHADAVILRVQENEGIQIVAVEFTSVK